MADLSSQLADALRGLRSDAVPFVATPASVRLEHDLVPFGSEEGDAGPSQRVQHLEGDALGTMPIPPPLRAASIGNMRYFLDGVQRTLPIGWCGMNALALVVVVAGVIERRPQDRIFRAVPGMLRVESSVIMASAPDDPHTLPLTLAFEGAGIRVTPCEEQSALALRNGDFLALQARIRPAVSAIRTDCEYAVFRAWDERTDGSEGWLVMDGSLVNSDAGNAVGIIKRHSRFDLTNAEMATLLAMPVGHRSSAFRRGVRGGLKPATWYLRFHERSGADPLFGLARIEAPSPVQSAADFDALSAVLFAERTPRATKDDRWPTLLYPIHIAERILKVKLERALLGVPAALRRHLREVA